MKLILDEIDMMHDSLVKNDVESYIELLTEKLSSSSGDIIGLAAGRMGYALRAFIMRLNHMGFNASMIGDTNVPRVKQDSILFINSSSGETPSILLFAEQAKNEKGEIFLTTCNKKSSIGKLSNSIIQIPTIQSVQLMKSPYEQFSMLLYDYIIYRLVETLALDKEKISSNHSILE
ncbi:MAG: hypothetical protein CL830_05580 [Crocinitomicaceae bacterium]|nr:hypothetical protein [Crocinitomicaceae bacterium]|tara:strand:- start:812 stop:1339 length:528 start_codon:yes stop_codon:yes gene_type:complete